MFRTTTCDFLKHTHRTLDPNWGEEFYLEWAELSSGKRLLTLEVWDWDVWMPDELLGRGFVNINDLAFEPLEVCAVVGRSGV
jgi:Ca2+-dependent lipid-binding protein